jgi:ribosomal protein S18 acetylase RimI-like enzyme
VETDEIVGYATWRIRKIRLPPSNKQHQVIELHYIGVIPAYQGKETTGGESVASQIFATAEAAARADPKAKKKPHIQTVLEVEVGNEHARDVYTKRWDFEFLGYRTAPGTDRRYEVMSRAAPADEGPAQREQGGDSSSSDRDGA